MSLSQVNIDKLNMNGLYHCNPVPEWLPSWKRDNPYWCRNWTFRVRKYDDDYYMYDTYWATGDENPVLLTDENFDLFELVFDFNDVEKFSGTYNQWLTYPDDKRWNVSIDSGGINNGRYFILKGAMPLKERVLARLKDKIGMLEGELEYKKIYLKRVEEDKMDLRFIPL